MKDDSQVRIYSRVARHDEQRLATQAEAILAEAERLGFSVGSENQISDLGRGGDEPWEGMEVAAKGHRKDRPGLTRLIREIESGSVRTVMIWDWERLSRSSLLNKELIEVFSRHQVTVIDRQGPVDCSTC